MTQVYSIAMYQVHNLSGVGEDFGPPEGFRWVLRGVDTVNGEALNNVMLKGAAGQVIWVSAFSTPLGFDYASYRGRHVIDFPDSNHFETSEAMDISAWGYQLSLP